MLNITIWLCRKNIFFRHFAIWFIRKSIAHKWPRKYLNNVYNKLDYKQLSYTHSLFAKIFRSKAAPKIDSEWEIKLPQNKIFIPLHQSSLWLDWDTALSFKGHDTEIKAVYESILYKSTPCFFDIGANYGTHSLLFLSKGCTVISFEPNPVCADYISRLFTHNHLIGNIQTKALGDTDGGVAQLAFYENDTWLGSLKTLEKRADIKTINVEVTTLDKYCYSTNIFPDIIKIDTEGFELEVLKGGLGVLNDKRPFIIFESNSTDDRTEIFELLIHISYSLKPLSTSSIINNVSLNKDNFIKSDCTNFIAYP